MDYKKGLIESTLSTRYPHYGSGAGDGIVYVGGGKYWPMIVAGICMLRDTGCTLPVEVWFRGACEEVHPEDVQGLGVRFHDVDSMSRRLRDSRVPTGLVCKGGWEAKLYSIYHTNFDRILFLDADAYCVRNPEPLFHLIEDAPFAYWKDLASTFHSVKWDGIYPEGAAKLIPQVQGGQLLIDRIKGQRLVSVANWMCQHSEYFFKQMYGDQDSWRVGLALGLAESNVIGEARWTQGIAFDCRYQNETYIIHRCRGKLFEPKYIPSGNTDFSNPNYAMPGEAKLFSYFAAAVNAHQPEAYDVFAEITKRRLWGNEAVSGAGSTLREGQLYIDTVNRLIREHKWNTVVDAGCGDGLIGSKLQVKNYIGVDCQPELIKRNKQIYTNRQYYSIDISSEYGKIEAADCLICKDVLHHWPTETITAFLDKLIESKRWKFILVCQDCNQYSDDQDCHLGGYRGLSLKMFPLNRYQYVYRASLHHKSLGLIKVGQ